MSTAAASPLTATFNGYITKKTDGSIDYGNIDVIFNENSINELANKLNAADADTNVPLMVKPPSSGGKSRKSRGGKSRKTRGGKMRKTKKHKK